MTPATTANPAPAGNHTVGDADWLRLRAEVRSLATDMRRIVRGEPSKILVCGPGALLVTMTALEVIAQDDLDDADLADGIVAWVIDEPASDARVPNCHRDSRIGVHVLLHPERNGTNLVTKTGGFILVVPDPADAAPVLEELGAEAELRMTGAYPPATFASAWHNWDEPPGFDRVLMTPAACATVTLAAAPLWPPDSFLAGDDLTSIFRIVGEQCIWGD